MSQKSLFQFERCHKAFIIQKMSETVYNLKDITNNLSFKRCRKAFIIFKMSQSIYNSKDVRNHV